MSNSLLKTLKSLRGNSKACVYCEPFFGISIALILPYGSVYMLAMGLEDVQVGFIAMVFMLAQVCSAFFSGTITDKLGRRKTTAIFDFIAFCIPCLIWWQATNFWFFLAAAIVNGCNQVVINSYNCLLIEDAEASQITGIKSLSLIAAQFSSFLGPLIVILLTRFGLVETMHILYRYAFVMMSIKITLTYIFTRETKMGVIRLAETKGKSIFSLAAGYTGVFKIIRQSGGTIFALAISIIVGIVMMINSTFWQVIISQRLLVPVQFLPFFPLLRAIMIIVFLFFIGPAMTKSGLKFPLLTGFICFFLGQLILILIPIHSSALYFLICISLVFDGFGFGALNMLARSLIALNVNAAERARVMAILNVIIMSFTAPFGWIAGFLSSLSRTYPFILNLFLLCTGFLVTMLYYGNKKKQSII